MKNKENILENINRIHLLMNYNSKKTLNENLDEVPKVTIGDDEVIREQGPKAFSNWFKKLFKTGAVAEFDAILQSIKNNPAVTEKGVRFLDGTFIVGGKELKAALNSGKQLSEEGLRNLRRGILGSTNKSLQKFQKEIVNEMLAQQGVLENLAKGVKDEKIYESIFDRFRKAGYSDDVCKELATGATNKIRGNSHLEDLIPKKTGGGTPPTPNPPVPPIKPTLWQRIKKYGLYALAGVGGLSLLYYFLYSGSDSGIKLPFCLKKKATEGEVEESKQNDFKNITIASTGNADIDAMGGATFDIDSNNVTLGDGSTGTWQVVGKKLNIYANGNTYSIECEQSETPPPPPPPVEDKKYKNCTDFPYVKYCKSEIIREIQNCLGITADSAYGPKTERALREAGYDTTITKEIYDEIMADCGKTPAKRDEEGGEESDLERRYTPGDFTTN